MEDYLDYSIRLIEQSGWLAPFLFIMLHVVRQLLLIPVLLICLLGGYLFGIVYGSLYSVIGLTAVSIVFYGMIHLFPKVNQKLDTLTKRLLKDTSELTVVQMMILRIMPFVHFHVVSVYLVETTKSFTSYIKKSFIVSIPPAIVYTAVGNMIHELPLTGTISFALFLTILFLFFRRKRKIIKWHDFFGDREKQ